MTDFASEGPQQPQVPDPEPPESPANIDTTVEIENLRSLNTLVAGKINIISQYLPDTAGPVTFSAEITLEVTLEREKKTKQLFVGDPAIVENLLLDLEKRRVLLLSGARGAGKATTAIYLSTRIADRRRFHQPTRLVGPLEPQVRIDLRAVAKASEHFGKRATVFTDTFARKNRDLLGSFTRMDQSDWEDLARTLRDNDAYIIFTADTEDVAKLRRQFAEGLVCCRDVPPLGPALVARGLDQKLAWLTENELAGPEHIRFVTEHRDRIVKELGTIDRISQFLDQYVTGDPDLDSALRRFHDLGFWFTKDLATDVDAWCFALTLVLAESVRGQQNTGWYEFERIRRALSERIKSDPEIFPRRRRPEAPGELETDDTTSAQSLTDDQLLARCRAEISGNSSRLGDTVRFTDSSYAATLWQVVAARHRRALTAMVPSLRTIAEDREESYGARSLAASMIGRIGEIDPFAMSIPLIRREWVDRREIHQRPFVGSLVQGILGTGNARYRQAALGALQSLATDGAGNDSDSNDRLLTAISAYSQLGEHDLPAAMEHLGAIATKQLAPAMEKLNQIGRLVDRVERQRSRTSSARTAEDLLRHQFRLGRLANKVSVRHTATLLALVHAVVYLCMANDAIQVLHAMRDWIARGGPSTGTLVALLFLHGGIAEQLEELSTNVGAMLVTHVTNPVLLALTDGDRAILRLGSFLADLHTSINQPFVLPTEIQRDLNDNFAECLTTWARGSSASDACRELVEDLFVSLTNIRDGAMREALYQLIASEVFTADAALRMFAANVRRKCLETAR